MYRNWRILNVLMTLGTVLVTQSIQAQNWPTSNQWLNQENDDKGMFDKKSNSKSPDEIIEQKNIDRELQQSNVDQKLQQNDIDQKLQQKDIDELLQEQ